MKGGPGYRLTRCVVCDGADTDVIAEADDIRAEVEALWAFHGRRLRPETPPERLVDRVAFSQRPPFRLVRCRACGLVFRNPIERDVELREIYADEAPPPETLHALHGAQRSAYGVQVRRLRAVLGGLGGGASGLEVGSYVGAFLAAARDAGLVFEGLDVNTGVNAFTRSLGFRVSDGDLAALRRDRSESRYGVVAVWNTFDQLPDPRDAANAAWWLLRPGGVLAVRVPNGAFYARVRGAAVKATGVRRRAGARAFARKLLARELLAQNNLLGFPYRFGFTPQSLGRLLDRTGFSVERVYGDVLVRTADEWTRPWARAEERVVKGLLRAVVREGERPAPWIEVYARKRA